MSSGPRVSILIPCYNAAKWVHQCIQSALDQTHPDKEVIVVDDGSTDGSWEIVSAFGDRIRCVRADHRGANAARNELLRLATGEWLQYLDADDYLLLDKVERHLQTARQSGGVDLVYSPVTDLDQKTGEFKTIQIDPSLDPTLHFIGWGAFATHAMLMSRQAVVEVGGWREDQPCCQEHELVLRLLTAGKRFVFTESSGSIYRSHGPGTISTRFPGLVAWQRIAMMDRLEDHLLRTGNLRPEYRRALCQARFDLARKIYGRDPAYATELMRKTRAAAPWFIPRGNSAPWHYRVVYMTLGFRGAECLATVGRRVRRRLIRRI